ncbi:hypothetical protein SAMN05421890_1215 [Ensifer adhaerens]|nr:hypothetical protein SAMN05421890_1215 [Ensifer adhaerens]
MSTNSLQKLLALSATLPLILLLPHQAFSAEKPAQPCKVQPHAQGQSPQANNQPEESRLGDCGGVLHPPAVGDPELVKPAPNVGKMPVIPPSAVPQEGEKGNDEQRPAK